MQIRELAVEVEEGIGGESVGEGAGADGQRVERRAEGAEAEGGAGLEGGGERGRDGRARRGGGAHLEEEGDGVEEVALGGGHPDLVGP